MKEFLSQQRQNRKDWALDMSDEWRHKSHELLSYLWMASISMYWVAITEHQKIKLGHVIMTMFGFSNTRFHYAVAKCIKDKNEDHSEIYQSLAFLNSFNVLVSFFVVITWIVYFNENTNLYTQLFVSFIATLSIHISNTRIVMDRLFLGRHLGTWRIYTFFRVVSMLCNVYLLATITNINKVVLFS